MWNCTLKLPQLYYSTECTIHLKNCHLQHVIRFFFLVKRRKKVNLCVSNRINFSLFLHVNHFFNNWIISPLLSFCGWRAALFFWRIFFWKLKKGSLKSYHSFLKGCSCSVIPLLQGSTTYYSLRKESFARLALNNRVMAPFVTKDATTKLHKKIPQRVPQKLEW